MTRDESSQFVEHLRQGGHLTRPVEREDASTADSDLQQKRLWEFTDLSTAEFADIAARFYHLERISLQDMLAAAPLAGAFSRRFLREMLVFPLQSADAVVLAVADPADRAAQRAAEIVLGPNIAFRVASAEDLAIVLNQRLGGASQQFGNRILRHGDHHLITGRHHSPPPTGLQTDLRKLPLNLHGSITSGE